MHPFIHVIGPERAGHSSSSGSLSKTNIPRNSKKDISKFEVTSWHHAIWNTTLHLASPDHLDSSSTASLLLRALGRLLLRRGARRCNAGKQALDGCHIDSMRCAPEPERCVDLDARARSIVAC